MRILAIESSCDETAAAVVEHGVRVRASRVASQVELHAAYGGIVPEVACRAHDEAMLPVVADALEQAGIADIATGIDAIAVTNRPGLIGALLIGLSAAKTLAWLQDKPLIAVDHLEGHVYSAAMAVAQATLEPDKHAPKLFDSAPDRGLVFEPTDDARSAFPSLDVATVADSPTAPIGLIISGGHSCMFRVTAPTRLELLGQTQDDAVGEAFDKVAAMLGLGYPGGPVIERTARSGDPRAFAFPRSLIHDPRPVFSFSGLKTAVRYALIRAVGGAQHELPDPATLDPQLVADLAASFQEAACETLVAKSLQAARAEGADTILVAGGVAANTRLRECYQGNADVAAGRVRVVIPPPGLCTDNAAFIAGLAEYHAAEGDLAELTVEASPRTRASRPSRG